MRSSVALLGDHRLPIGDVGLVAVHGPDRLLVSCERSFHRLRELAENVTPEEASWQRQT